MDVIIAPDAASAIGHVAGLIAAAVAERPDMVIGLATGATMEPLYDRLAALPGGAFARSRFFSLDEYVGLAADDPGSFRHYLDERFFRPAGIAPAQAVLIRGDAADPREEADRYEVAIAARGIDLQLLGLGHNGHIGFNEPLSGFRTRTRVVELTGTTIAENARSFADAARVPHRAITMGIGTILEARRIVLVATGTGKQAAARAMIEGPMQAMCPASALQLHANATVVLDRDAAGALERAAGYRRI